MDGQRSRARQTQNISLDPDESKALRWLADEEDRGIVSWQVQRLIDAKMRERVGRDWREMFVAEQNGHVAELTAAAS